jgi:GMP synthase (glutamine-hydrolysing)
MSATPPVLILQLRPEDATSDSEYACLLKYGDLRAGDTHRIRIEQSGIPNDLDPGSYSAIIVGGSPFDISTPQDKKSHIQNRIEADFNKLLEQVVTRDIPFFGACSGNGLLGNYLGASVSTRYREAVGCVTLDTTDEGQRDPLLAGFPGQIDVLLGHKEAVDTTPDGAVLLMTGDACPVQMFRVGNNVYATQFHPEADADEFVLRIDVYRDHGYFQPDEADALKKKVRLKSTPYAHEILRRFVQRYCYGND